MQWFMIESCSDPHNFIF